MTEECKHSWRLGSAARNKNDKNERITHEVCGLCAGERDLIETIHPYSARHTGIEYPNGRKEQVTSCSTTPQGNEQVAEENNIPDPENTTEEKDKEAVKVGNITLQESHKEYEARKSEIIAAFREAGVILHAAKKLEIPATTLRGLLIQWGEFTPGTAKKPNRFKAKEETKPPAGPPQASPDPEPVKKMNAHERHLYFEEHAQEIIQDLKAGMHRIKVEKKWSISAKALLNLRHRHGLVKEGTKVELVLMRQDMITLFEKALQEDTIEAARSCWKGIKIAKGYESESAS